MGGVINVKRTSGGSVTARTMNAAMVAENFGEACPASAPFFGYMGAAAALIFASE